MEIKDKVAVITGGASGLGRATAEHLVSKGGKVVLFDLNEALGRQLAAELGECAAFIKVDVTSEPGVEQGIAFALEIFGAIHVCVNCAGVASGLRTVGRDGPHPLAEFQKIIDLNLVGTFNVLRLCAAQMVVQDAQTEDGERGVIINTASVAAVEGQIGQVAYAASKAGIVGMTLTIARDLGKLGVRCNTILPGSMQTPLMDWAPPAMQETLKANAQFPRRMGKPGEFAQLAAHLIENSYLNGESIRLDAGCRMPPK